MIKDNLYEMTRKKLKGRTFWNIAFLMCCSTIFMTDLMAANEHKKKSQTTLTSTTNSNESKRTHKTFSVSITPPFSGYMFMTFGYGGEVEYFLNKNNLIGSAYHQGGFIMGNMDFKNSTLNWRRHWSDSFYSNVGLGYSEYSYFPRFGLENEKVTGLTNYFSIGNRWYWDNYSHGVDWAGVFISLVEKSSMRSERRLNIKLREIQLLHYYIGITF